MKWDGTGWDGMSVFLALSDGFRPSVLLLIFLFLLKFFLTRDDYGLCFVRPL